jgi:hypothetical protein
MKHFKIFSFLALVMLMTGCYPSGPEYIDQYDLVYSNYDSQYDFTAKQTYAIPDKIMKVTDELINGDDPTFVKEPYATQMLTQINKNMADFGWVKVSKDQNPDVVLNPVAYELTTYSYWYAGGYWGWWYGGWYYPYPVVTSYSTGSLVVTMTDPNEMSADDKARAVWSFVVNGLLEGTAADFTARYTKGINQAYEQSQYLKQ